MTNLPKKTIEDLIKLVSQNSMLYDSKDRQYYSRGKEKIWEQIASALGRESALCLDEWNRLKKSYVKGDRRSIYAEYFHLLTFLDVNNSGRQVAQSPGRLNTNVGSDNHDGSPVPICESFPVAGPSREIEKKLKEKKESVTPEGSSLNAKEAMGDDSDKISDRFQIIMEEFNQQIGEILMKARNDIDRQINELQIKAQKVGFDMLSEFKAMTLDSASGSGSTGNTTL